MASTDWLFLVGASLIVLASVLFLLAVLHDPQHREFDEELRD